MIEIRNVSIAEMYNYKKGGSYIEVMTNKQLNSNFYKIYNYHNKHTIITWKV